jgi:nitroreductase
MTSQSALLLDDPWQVDPANFPKGGRTGDKLTFLLNYAALAPSILNTQPWLFRITTDSVALLADSSRRLPITDPDMRELTISCGAALLNLRVAAQSFGYDLACTTFPDSAQPELLAQARLRRKSAIPADRRLRDAMMARRTIRDAFANRSLPKELTDKLLQASKREGAALTFVDDPKGKRRVWELIADAERALLADPAFRSEISRWIEKRISEAHDRDSEARWRLGPALSGSAGHTPESRLQADFFTPMAASAARSYVRAEQATENQRPRAEGAPVLALLSTTGDSPGDWLAAGQALQYVLLLAAAEGVSASFLNPAIELISLRTKIAKAFGASGNAQVLLRLGYGPSRQATARRSARELLL